MTARAPTLVLITIVGPDRVGLIAEITGELYDLGANLGDTSFAVLGAGCEFSCVAELPAGVHRAEIEAALARLPAMAGAELRVAAFPFGIDHRETAEVSHVIEVEGGDRPGLVARLSEVFVGFGANVVRMHSRRRAEGESGRYLTTFAVSIPDERAEACLAAVHNTAGQLNLICRHHVI